MRNKMSNLSVTAFQARIEEKINQAVKAAVDENLPYIGNFSKSENNIKIITTEYDEEGQSAPRLGIVLKIEKGIIPDMATAIELEEFLKNYLINHSSCDHTGSIRQLRSDPFAETRYNQQHTTTVGEQERADLSTGTKRQKVRHDILAVRLSGTLQDLVNDDPTKSVREASSETLVHSTPNEISP